MTPNSPQPQPSRVTRTKDQAREAYNAMSRWYDALAGSSERPLAEIGLGQLAARQGENLLEIGYGTGHATLALAQAVGNAGKVYGIDLSEGMRQIARERIARAGLAARVQLELGDAAALPFDGGFFDAIFMSFVLELFDTPEIPLVLAECRRVLKPGGRLGVVALVRGENETLMLKAYEWAHRQFPAYVDCRPIFLRAALESAGFQILETIQKQMWGLPVEISLAKR